jgi:hypothetical protein
MSRGRHKLRCICGGEIKLPVPSRCPHCGAALGRVRKRFSVSPVVIVAALFALLMALLVWLIQRG